MHTAPFEYVRPASLDEAVAALASNPDARVLAGGHSLIPMMKLRLVAPGLLIDLGDLEELRGVAVEGSTIHLGSMTTHAEVAASPDVQEMAPALVEAAATVGDSQVRNRGTVGGSAAHGDAVADEPGALLALDASFSLSSSAGTREVAADEFFLDAFTTAIGPHEILTKITVPAGLSSAYVKVGRRGRSLDYPVAGAAVRLDIEDGVVARARVALTGSVVKPVRSVATEDALVGSVPSVEVIAGAAEAAADGITVVGDIFGSVEYKTHLTKVVVRRALERALP